MPEQLFVAQAFCVYCKLKYCRIKEIIITVAVTLCRSLASGIPAEAIQ